MKPGAKDPEHGSILIEVLASLTIVALAATVAIPALRPPTQLQLDAEATRLRHFLREARAEAQLSGHTSVVEVDVDQHELRYGRKKWQMDSHSAMTSTTARETNRSTSAILFFSNGTSSGGRISLRRDNFRRDVIIRWISGFVEIDP